MQTEETPSKSTNRSIPRRGEVAVMSVLHPVLGTPLDIAATTIRLGPEQYALLCDELCNLIFLVPHLAPRIRDLARELDLREVVNFAGWQREADKAKAQPQEVIV